MLKSQNQNNCYNKNIYRSHDNDFHRLQECEGRRGNVTMFRCKFIYLLLMLLYFAIWIDGIEARQQKHDAQEQQQINEVGAHHHHRSQQHQQQHQQHHNRGNSGGGSRSSYEVIKKRNKKNNQNHNKNGNNNNSNHNYNEKKHKSSIGDVFVHFNNGNSSVAGVSKALGNGGRKGDKKQRRAHHRKRNRSNDPDDNISLWINEQQLKALTGNV